jgi:hypothetical protein
VVNTETVAGNSSTGVVRWVALMTTRSLLSAAVPAVSAAEPCVAQSAGNASRIAWGVAPHFPALNGWPLEEFAVNVLKLKNSLFEWLTHRSRVLYIDQGEPHGHLRPLFGVMKRTADQGD